MSLSGKALPFLLLALLHLTPLIEGKTQDCDYSLEQFTVRGVSMPGIAENESEIVVAMSYYKCKAVERGDVVLLEWVGNDEPLIKRVLALPGDAISLLAVGSKFHILINGNILVTTLGKPYLLHANAARMIKVYIDSYRGELPKNAFLVMGNRPEGTMDATRFGYVGREKLLGKMVK